MSSDLMDQVRRIIEWITGLGFLLPVAIFVGVQLFNRGKSEQKPADRGNQPSRPAPAETSSSPTAEGPIPLPEMPFGLPTWLGLDQPAPEPAPTAMPKSQWGHNFDRQATTSGWGQEEDWGHGYDHLSDAEDDVLRWGSAFENDAEGEPIRWTSAFDDEEQRNVYGWEGTTWGGTFPPRDSDPVIHYG